MQKIEIRPFGISSKGDTITEFTLVNINGVRVSVINYGGIITKIEVPDKNDHVADITLGYDTLEEYEKDTAYFGALVGRFGNRIDSGLFELNGETYQLPINNGKHHLHGGPKGFHCQYWDIEADEANNKLKLSYLSKDGEEGYPGNLTVEVTYQLTDKNELIIQYQGSTDKTTIFNPTQHAYFNLSGDQGKQVLDHQLLIASEKVLEINKNLIPSGDYITVRNGPLDFNSMKSIGLNIENPIIQDSMGYDHCYSFNPTGSTINVAEVTDPQSKRSIKVYTTSPGMQFYTGNLLEGTIGKNGIVYPKHGGFCLETQLFPDSPNHAHFSNSVVEPGKSFTATTIYEFGW